MKFQFTLERFVIELMLNQPYEKLSALNIKVLEEFLDNHYLNDKMCILDVNYIIQRITNYKLLS